MLAAAPSVFSQQLSTFLCEAATLLQSVKAAAVNAVSTTTSTGRITQTGSKTRVSAVPSNTTTSLVESLLTFEATTLRRPVFPPHVVSGVQNVTSKNLLHSAGYLRGVNPLRHAHVPVRGNWTQQRHSSTFASNNSYHLKILEQDANNMPNNAQKQAELCAEYNKFNPWLTVNRVQSNKYATNDAVVKEFAAALTQINRMSAQNLAQISSAGFNGNVNSAGLASTPSAPAYQNMTAFGYSAGAAQTGAAAGTVAAPAWSPQDFLAATKSLPIVVEMHETLKSLFLRLALNLSVILAFFVGVHFLMEERGLGKVPGMTMQGTTEPTTSNSKYRFEDVQGVDEAKAELQEVVEYLRDPAKFTRLGGKLPKGILLTGPPGTGKTLLAKTVSGEADVAFYYVSGSEFDEMFVGVGARRVRDLFNSAKKNAPCIIFIDELDAIGSSRSPKDFQMVKMTLNQLLVEMDGFASSEGVIIIGATNFPELLDKALIRPGRFDKHVSVPLPDVRGREQILRLHTKQVPLDKSDVDFHVLARGTPGFSGAELANMVNQAAIKAATDGVSVVSMSHFEYAKDKIIMGAERKSAVIEESNRRIVAFHEAGHALVALKTPGAMPIHKATIMPRGQALGMVSQLPEKDELSWTRKQLLARMDVAFGGRAAEELMFGSDSITSGASSDIEAATRVASAMVMRYGMSPKVGPVTYRDDDLPKLSSETRATIDNEIKGLLQAARDRATAILKANKEEWFRLANALLEYETLTRDEIDLVIKGLPLDRDKVTPPKTADEVAPLPKKEN